MITLIHQDTKQEVTFEDATNFLSEIADPHLWLEKIEGAVEEVEHVAEEAETHVEHEIETLTDVVEDNHG